MSRSDIDHIGETLTSVCSGKPEYAAGNEAGPSPTSSLWRRRRTRTHRVTPRTARPAPTSTSRPLVACLARIVWQVGPAGQVGGPFGRLQLARRSLRRIGREGATAQAGTTSPVAIATAGPLSPIHPHRPRIESD